MVRRVEFAFGSILFGLGLGTALAVPPAHSSWSLIFSDEFEGATLDASKWGNGYALEKTGPRSWADPANVKLENGCLKLSAANRPGQGKEFAGAAVITRGKFSNQYGYMEARVKVPVGNGLSAKMTGVPAQGSFPPWLDVVETLGRTPNYPYWYIHAGGKEAGGGWTVPNMAADYHVFGTEWNANEFIFYFDGVERMRDRTLAPLVRMAMCWALEMMVGDNNAGWIGTPNSASWSGVYEVDYVRIYRREGPVALSNTLVPSPRVIRSAPLEADMAAPAYLLTGRRPARGSNSSSMASFLCGGDGCRLNPAP